MISCVLNTGDRNLLEQFCFFFKWDTDGFLEDILHFSKELVSINLKHLEFWNAPEENKLLKSTRQQGGVLTYWIMGKNLPSEKMIAIISQICPGLSVGSQTPFLYRRSKTVNSKFFFPTDLRSFPRNGITEYFHKV